MSAAPARGRIQAVDRTLDVIEALAEREGSTLTELSLRLGQPVATIYRILITLESRRYVEVNSDTQEWHVGSQVYRMGAAFLRRSDVVELSRPVMRSLMAETGETSNLGIEKSGKVLFVSQVETQKSIRAFFPPGTLSPMHASGIGKALLSAYDDNRLERFLRAVSLDPFTETTLISREGLIADLRVARDRGFALDDEERTVGMRCIASCIRNTYGEVVAGISISGPTNRLPDDKIEELGVQVKKAAEEISSRLGAP
nr:HTH-type transcriptional regulator BhcR [Methylobacterium gnaphalii]